MTQGPMLISLRGRSLGGLVTCVVLKQTVMHSGSPRSMPHPSPVGHGLHVAHDVTPVGGSGEEIP